MVHEDAGELVADGALHDGYLKPLADHADVMVVVLNQVDKLSVEEQKAAAAHLRQLLNEDGLTDTEVAAQLLGREVEAGEEVVVIESVKAASDISAPIAGVITAVNAALADAPGSVRGPA